MSPEGILTGLKQQLEVPNRTRGWLDSQRQTEAIKMFCGLGFMSRLCFTQALVTVGASKRAGCIESFPDIWTAR